MTEDKTVARLRIESGRARLPQSSNSLATAAHGDHADGPARIRRRLRAARAGDRESPGNRVLPRGSPRRDAPPDWRPERGDVSSLRVELAPTVRADVGARQIHLALLGILVANEPGLRANLDTEFLHDFRVAIRRTRSLLGQIKHVFPPDAVEHFSTEFSWVGRLTGPPRDLDVLVLALSENTGRRSCRRHGRR